MRGRRRRGVIIGALFGLGALALVGAGGRMLDDATGASASASAVAVASAAPGTPSPSPSPSPTPSPSPSPAPTATPFPTIHPVPTRTVPPPPTPSPTPSPTTAPLTGETVRWNVARRRPIAVMIDDLSPARPQSGLHSADIVWHAPAEGGIPRYMAIFQTKLPESIGPIRSVRSYYLSWAAEWRALLAHAGGSPQALATLRSKGRGQYVYNGEYFRFGSAYFHRLRSRASPHNVYSDGATLRQLGKDLGAKDDDFEPFARFLPDAPEVSRPDGGLIRVAYRANVVTYRYARSTNTYRRSVSVEGKQVDANDGARVEPKNVIVMVVRFAQTGDSKHRLEADLTGSGRAWISTNGRTVEGVWKKSGTTKPTRFYDRSGNRLNLTIGQTFIQVVGSSRDVRFEAGTEIAPED